VSKRGDAKKARRKKRQSAVRRVPAEVMDQLAAIPDGIVADLAEFDERITARGWTFDDEESDDNYAIWFHEPSGADVADGLPVTSLWLDAAEDGALVHVVFVGSVEQHVLTHDALFAHLGAIEAYRSGDALPAFG
jgi:hypothetical protein